MKTQLTTGKAVNYLRYFTATKPLINNITNMMERMLKYFSINVFIFGPKKYNNPATIKNLALLLKADARIRVKIFTLQTPAEMVNTLYGMGVNPATAIAENALF